MLNVNGLTLTSEARLGEAMRRPTRRLAAARVPLLGPEKGTSQSTETTWSGSVCSKRTSLV
jgi:hypothetical protein